MTEPTAPVAPEPAAPAAPAEVETTLADHERSYAPGAKSSAEPEPVSDEPAKPEPDAEPSTEPADKPAEEPSAAESRDNRDEKGRFTKPRHRARSQQASPDDVPRIQELTRRLREAEAELAKRSTGSAEPAPKAAEPKAPTFPSFEEWAKAHDGATWDDYADARADWRYDMRRASERAAEQRTAAERDYRERLTAYESKLEDAVKQFPDFEDVVNPNGETIEVTKAIEFAVLDVGPAAAYYLATHRDELDALIDDTAIEPSNPAFKSVVATTARYLKTLVASSQRSDDATSRPAAAKTGSALSIVPKSAPKPPNPVRTGAIRESDALPGEASTLADHERAFAPRRRA